MSAPIKGQFAPGCRQFQRWEYHKGISVMMSQPHTNTFQEHILFSNHFATNVARVVGILAVFC